MEDLKLLREDHHYYGDVGNKYLSNSDLGTLLKNPKEYGQPRPDNKNFAEGRYFHQCILEVEKAKVFPYIDVASRNTKAYKEMIEETGEEVILLLKEKQAIDELVGTLIGNFHMYDLIYDVQNDFEIPAIGEVCGHQFKGKADIVCPDMLIDLKTTSNLNDFRYNARKYNYDSQAYIYQELFGKPLMFIAIDKVSHMIGQFTLSEEFIRGGKDKVEKAMEVYDKFFGENPTEDINTFFTTEEL
jgi:hypothetical protein